MKERKEKLIIIPGYKDPRTPIFSVLVKRTYHICAGSPLIRAEVDNPFTKTDKYYDDDPQNCTVKYETDIYPYKVATDVVIIGKVYAPANKPIRQIDVSIEVPNRKKMIRIIGDRQCIYRKNKPPLFTDPVEFKEMEIRYERAYGGWDKISIQDIPFYYPRNPMGRGIVLKNIPEMVNGLLLPNLEDPNDMITPEKLILEDPKRWNLQPLPQGFGWMRQIWYPRCSFVGAIPALVQPGMIMKEEYLGIVPKNQIALAWQFKLPSFDVRFNNGASYGLILPYLKGNEPVRLKNLTPAGNVEFNLPNDNPKIMLDIGLGENELKVDLHTVCIRTEDMQVDMVWRGAHEYPGTDWLPEMKKMTAKIF